MPAPQNTLEATSVWLRPSRAPREPALGREEITRAAIDLADELDLEAVTMRRIAARLNAAAPSLYWYVKSKSDLYELMADAVLGEIVIEAVPSRDWRDHLRSVAHATLTALRAHGWYTQLGVQPVLGPHAQRYAAVATGSLKERGLSTDTQMKMVIALHDYVVGFVHREHAILRLIRRSGLDTADWRRQVADYLTRTTNDPIFADRIAKLASRLGQDTFEFGLQSLLDGFEARLAEE